MKQTYQIANVSRRFVAFAIDFIVIVLFVFFLDVNLKVLPDGVSGVLLFTLFIFKDIFGGQSIGKKLISIQIRSASDYSRPVSKIRAVLRNIPLVLIWAVDLPIMMASNRNQRLGEIMTKCVVVNCAPVTGAIAEQKAAKPIIQEITQDIALNSKKQTKPSKWPILNKDLQFNQPVNDNRHDHIKLGRRRKVDYDRDYIKKNDWE